MEPRPVSRIAFVCVLLAAATVFSSCPLIDRLFHNDGGDSQQPVGHFALARGEQGEVVLFGGDSTTSGTEQNATWLFDPETNSWTDVSAESNTTPPARACHVMAYAGNNTVVMFGGGLMHGYSDINAFEYRDDTWEYDLTTREWTQISAHSAPSGRVWSSMSYAGGTTVVMFGGLGKDSNGEPFNYGDTWEYDSSTDTWTSISPSDTPSSRIRTGLAWLGGADVLLFGGSSGIAYFNDSWIYDTVSRDWTELSVSGTLPQARNSHGMAYLSDNKVFLASGNIGDGSKVVPFWDAWTFDARTKTWSEINTTDVFADAEYSASPAAAHVGSNSCLFRALNETYVYSGTSGTWATY